MITYEDIKTNKEIRAYISGADESLKALGFTEHSFAHVEKVATRAQYLLETLGYSEREVNLVKIAAYLHDIGNLVNRIEHSQTGGIMAFSLLREMGMEPEDISQVVAAIGNHDEGTGVPLNPIAAALILADKTDVRRSRVRNQDVTTFDIHDRVNYSVERDDLTVSQDGTQLILDLTVNTKYGSVMDYFEIFLERMILCRKAAEVLGLSFKMVMNGQWVL